MHKVTLGLIVGSFVLQQSGEQFNVTTVFIDVMFRADSLRHLSMLTVLVLQH